MRPTNEILSLLLIGLLPPLYTLVTSLRGGWQQLFRLRAVMVAAIWLAYQYGPWYTYLTGKVWDVYLANPRFTGEGLFFSTLCMVGVILGYDWMARRCGLEGQALHFSVDDLPEVKTSWLWGLAIVSLVLFAVTAGSWSDIWFASYRRGDYLWVERRDLLGKLMHVLRVLSQLVYAVLAALATIYLLQNPHRAEEKNQPLIPLGRYALGFTCLVVASLSRTHQFSRGAGMAFAIFAFFAPRFRGKRALPAAAAAFGIALYLGSIGLYARGMYYPGLGNFWKAATDEQPTRERTLTKPTWFFLAGSNPLDGMAAWTRKAEAGQWEKPNLQQMAPRYFWGLNPLPSEVVPVKPIGRPLDEVMHTTGIVGLSTPAMAEMYYVFGNWGWLLMIPLGAVYAWFEDWSQRAPGPISLICLLLCFISVPMGLQQNSRALTRSVLYAVIVYFIATRFLGVPRRRSVPFIAASPPAPALAPGEAAS